MAKKQKFQARQGDVLLVQTDEIIEGEREIRDSDGAITLAHGEVTGHRHRFVVGKDTGEVVANRSARQLTLKQTTALMHEEHTHIDIPGGIRIDLPKQVEWQDSMEPRQVAD